MRSAVPLCARLRRDAQRRVRAEPRGLGATIAVVSESARAAANACVVWYTVPRESVPRLHAYLRRALDDAAEDETSDPTDEGSNPADERDAADEADARFGDPPPLRYRTALVDAGSLWIDPAGVARWNASRGRSDGGGGRGTPANGGG